MIPSTPQPAFEPRSTIIRASIPVSVPSLRAPILRCVTCADAGFVAWKSSLRVSTSRTGRRSASAAPAASGSTSANLPPNAPPSGSAITRIALEREVERARELAPRDERALRARRDDERPGRLEPGGADLRLDVRLVHPRRPERPLDDGVARGERRGDVAVLARDAVEDVAGELLRSRRPLAVVDAGVDRLEVAALVVRSSTTCARAARPAPSPPRRRRPRRAARSRRRRARRRPRRPPRSRRRRARPAGRRTRPPRARAAPTVRSVPVVASGRSAAVEHRDDTRDGERGVRVDAANARVRLGGEDGPRVQEAVDVAVGRVPRRAGHLVGRVDARARDADQCRSSVLLRALARAVERALGDDAGELAPVLGRREAVAEDLGLREAAVVAAARDGVAPIPVSATVSPSGVDERRRSGEREPGRGMLDRDVRRARTRRRDRNDDVGHELLRPERGRERPDEKLGDGERRALRRASAAEAARRARAGRPACPRPGRRGRRFRRSSRGCAPAGRRSRARTRRARPARAARAARRPMSSSQVVSGPMWSSPSRSVDAAEVEPGDVDDERRPRDAELHHRDERLAAGDRLRVGLGEELERVVEVGRARVARRRGDHEAQLRPRGSTRRCSGSRCSGRGCRAARGGSSSSLGESSRESRSAAVRITPACRSRTAGRGARRTRAGAGAARRPARAPRSS